MAVDMFNLTHEQRATLQNAQGVHITQNKRTLRNRLRAGMNCDQIKLVEAQNAGLERVLDPNAKDFDRVIIPEDIDRHIDNKAYRNRVRFLIELEGVEVVRQALTMSKRRTKETDENGVRKVNHYFMKILSVENWRKHTRMVLEDARTLFERIRHTLHAYGEMFAELLNKGNYPLVCKFINDGHGMEELELIARTARHKDKPARYALACMNNAIYGNN